MGQVICIGTKKAKVAIYQSLEEAYIRKHNIQIQMGNQLLELEKKRSAAYRLQTEVINHYGFDSPEYKAGNAEEIRLRAEVSQYKLQMEQTLADVENEIKEIKQRRGMD